MARNNALQHGVSQVASKVKPRLFLITFDLAGPRPGDRRYNDVDRALRRLGELHKPVKQVRLLVADALPRRISRRIHHYIGSAGNITVLRIGRLSEIDIADPILRRAIRNLILQHGV